MRWSPSRSGAARPLVAPLPAALANRTVPDRRLDECNAAPGAGVGAKTEETSMPAVSANRLELLQIADAVAREKAIDRTIVITAMEDAIAKAARSRYGSETDVHAEINAKTGELRLARHLLVV